MARNARRRITRTLITTALVVTALFAATPAYAATAYVTPGYHPYWRYYKSQPSQPSRPSQPSQPSTPAPQQPTVPGTGTGVGSMQMSSWELEVIRLVNVERAKAGLKPLTANSELSRVARYKAADMRDNGYFGHESPTYGSPFEMMKDFGISYRVAGENIAAGQRSPQEVMNAWMNSAGHRANILNPNFTVVGVGQVSGGYYGNYWTQMFVG
ncbi:MAG: CAP domain-containing protein [Ignavibacteriales bacterium]